MKLQLLIPQYNEDITIVRSMLDSIRTQQGIDFNDIEVLYGNDGSDVKLPQEFLSEYPFSIKYFEYEHSGTPGTRKNLFNEASADYVMFCDADDMFFTNAALYAILSFIDEKYDAIVCDFMEELQDRKSKVSKFFPHHHDLTFVHGKIYRRQFLIDNNIVWHPDVTCHEDSGYNLLAITMAGDNIKYFDKPIYLWKWRDNSICRADPLYVPKTYTRMIYSNAWLVKDLLQRHKMKEAKHHCAMLIYSTYFMLNKPIWLDPLNDKYRYDCEKCFQQYYQKHNELFFSIPDKDRNELIAGAKRKALSEGILFEEFTFRDWIKHIETLD